MEAFTDASVIQVKEVCPDVDVSVIQKDLIITCSAEETINRILDGRIDTEKDSSRFTCSSMGLNSDSDVDLPVLRFHLLKKKYQNISGSSSSCSSTNSRKHFNCHVEPVTSSTEKSNLVIDLSQDEDSKSVATTDINSDGDGDLPDVYLKTNNCHSGNNPQSKICIDLKTNIYDRNNPPNKICIDSDTDNTSNSNIKKHKKDKNMDEQFRFDSIDSDDGNDSDSDQGHRPGLLERCGFKPSTLNAPSTVSTRDNSKPSVSRVTMSRNFCNSDDSTDNLSIHQIDSTSDQHQCQYVFDSDVPYLPLPVKRKNTASSTAQWETGEEVVEEKKKRRTAEEIAESKRLAEEKRMERRQQQERKKAQRQQDTEKRKALQENRRHFRAGDCVKFMTVSVDPGVINTGQLGVGIFKACADLGANCLTEPQSLPNLVTWRREVLDFNTLNPEKKDVEDNVLAIITMTEFLPMVQKYIKFRLGDYSYDAMSVKEYIENIQQKYRGKTVSVCVLGKEQYFRSQKLSAKRSHRDAILHVTGEEDRRKKKRKNDGGGVDIVVSRVEMEEALIDAQLHTSCVVQFPESSQDAVDIIKAFTKAVADKPAKKDRLDNVFDFLVDGAAGVKVDKNGHGFIEVWKHQLLQLKNVGPDMASAVISKYPSPRMLYETYERCSTEKEAQKLLENIVVRRGAGVLVTNRRIGKELSRKIYSLFTKTDPDFLIK